MRTILSILFMFLIFHFAHAQDLEVSPILARRNITQVLGFVKMNVNQDSLLKTHEWYNKKGRRIKIDVFHCDDQKVSYEYDYFLDTLKTKRRTFFNDSLFTITKLVYNKYGQILKEYDVDASGLPTGLKRLIKYDKRRRQVESKLYINQKVHSWKRYKYHTNDSLRASVTYLPSSQAGVVRYSRFGECKNPNKQSFIRSRTRRMTPSKTFIEIETAKANGEVTLLAATGELAMSKGDVLVKEKTFDHNGLLVKIAETLNGDWIGEKYYVYRH